MKGTRKVQVIRIVICLVCEPVVETSENNLEILNKLDALNQIELTLIDFNKLF